MESLRDEILRSTSIWMSPWKKWIGCVAYLKNHDDVRPPVFDARIVERSSRYGDSRIINRLGEYFAHTLAGFDCLELLYRAWPFWMPKNSAGWYPGARADPNLSQINNLTSTENLRQRLLTRQHSIAQWTWLRCAHAKGRKVSRTDVHWSMCISHIRWVTVLLHLSPIIKLVRTGPKALLGYLMDNWCRHFEDILSTSRKVIAGRKDYHWISDPLRYGAIIYGPT